jgi:hypothetical protein
MASRRRVLHVPASDVKVGDLISFRGHLVPTVLMGEAVVTEWYMDHSDGEIYITFEPHHYNAFFRPAEQLVLLQEID